MRLYDAITQSELNGVIDLLLNNYHRELSLNIDDTSNSYCGLSFDLSDGVDAGSEIIFNNGDELSVTISDKRLALMGYTLRLNYYQLDKGDYSQSKPYGELQTLEVKLENETTVIPFTDNQVYLQKDFELVLLKDIGYRLLLSTPSSIVLSGEDVILTADYTLGSVPVEDAEVSFYNGNTLIGTAVTDSDGLAVLTVSNLSKTSHNFSCTCNTEYSDNVIVTIVDKSKFIRLDITGDSFSTYSSTPFYYSMGNKLAIDWGDNTPLSEYEGGQLSHNYTATGNYTIKIYGNIKYLNQSCFKDCTNLTSVILPSTVTRINSNCFENCFNLTSINLSRNLTLIGDSSFNGCIGLTSLSIRDGVTSLGEYCFYGCSGLTSVTVPSSLVNMGRGCFSHCTSLTSISVPNAVESIGDYCFDHDTSLTLIRFNWNTNAKILEYESRWMQFTSDDLKLSIPNGTTSLYTAKGYPSDKLEERT